MGIGEKLKELYKEKGLTQAEFADAIDESISQVNKVVNGHRNVSSEMLQKIIKFFPLLDLNWFLKEDITLRSIVSEDGAVYKIEHNPSQILKNMEEELKVLKAILPQK